MVNNVSPQRGESCDLPIDSVEPYDRNPRQAPNSAYEALKLSIRKRGYQGILAVFCRPGENRYMVAEGGNTTLQILKELWQETQLPKYATVRCMVQPWVSESDTLLAHLIENDTRGELVFIDRARAIKELRALLQTDMQKEISEREFVELLRGRGYTISRQTVAMGEYAMKILPRVPIAYAEGMGPKQTERIRKIESVFVTFLESRGKSVDDIQRSKGWFLGCLAKHDGADLAHCLDPVQYDVELYLRDACAESLFKVRADFQIIYETGRPGRDALRSEKVEDEAPLQIPLPLAEATRGTDVDDVDEKRSLLTPVRKPDQVHSPSPRTPVIQQGAVVQSNDVKSLRTRLWTLALELAQHFDFPDCVQKVDAGCGFIIDLPEAPLFAKAFSVTSEEATRVTLWWMLAGLADQWPTGPGEIHADSLLREARIYPAILAVADENYDLQSQILDPIVGFPPSLEIATRRLFTRLDEHDYQRLTDMFSVRRILEAHINRLGKSSVWMI